MDRQTYIEQHVHTDRQQYMDRQTYIEQHVHTDRQQYIDRQTDRTTYRQTDGQQYMGKQTDRQQYMDIQTIYEQTYNNIWTDIPQHVQIDRQTTIYG